MSDAPTAELQRGPAARDIVAGLVLLGLGVATGGSSLFASHVDGVDVFFDLLAAAWIGFGLWRWFRSSSLAR